MFVHATSVALRRRGRTWRGVLLRGPSGAGKSDLALRLIEAGARLIADDQTHVERRGRRLVARAPAALKGLIEARGVGILRLPPDRLLGEAALALLVDLVPPDKIERLPDQRRENLQGVELACLALAPFEASAVTKLLLALDRITAA